MSTIINSIQTKIPKLEITTDIGLLKSFQWDDSGFSAELPIAVVKPNTLPQVSQLVSVAKDLGIQLQPISSTVSHHRGDTLCTSKNTVIVDMSGFDEVVRVDRRNRVTMIEAGVTFDALTKEAQTVNLRPMLPLCPRPGKSAMAAYLEREPTIYPRFQWDISDPLLCVEVVFGSGEFFRTGGAAGPGTLEEQWATGNAQKTPLGPGNSDLQRVVQGAQGSLGIVTWCTAKAEPIPPKETLYVLESESLDALIDISYKLLRRSHPDICFIVDGNGLSALRHRNEEDCKNTAAANKPWNLVFSLSAPETCGDEKLAYVQEEVQEICARYSLDQYLCNFEPRHQELHEILIDPSHPANKSWWKQAGKTGTRELFFQTTLDKTPNFLTDTYSTAVDHGWSRNDVITYIQPQLGGRCCHMEFIFPHEKQDQEKDQAISQMVFEMAKTLKVRGAFYSRPYGPITELSKLNTTTEKMFSNVKTIFDPDGVMASAVI